MSVAIAQGCQIRRMIQWEGSVRRASLQQLAEDYFYLNRLPNARASPPLHILWNLLLRDWSVTNHCVLCNLLCGWSLLRQIVFYRSVVPLDRILCRRSAKLSAGFDPVRRRFTFLSFRRRNLFYQKIVFRRCRGRIGIALSWTGWEDAWYPIRTACLRWRRATASYLG